MPNSGIWVFCDFIQHSVCLWYISVMVIQSVICQTAYFELKRISSIRRFLTEDATKTLVTSYILSRLDYCNCLLMGTLILSFNLSRKFRTSLQDLFSWHPVTATQHLSWKKLHWLPISERIKYKVACMCFSAINGSGPAYLSELLHVYTPSRTLRSSSDNRMLEIQQDSWLPHLLLLWTPHLEFTLTRP